ncbi:MAG TPA: YihY/virulence factor BrkB family protein [Candidatus Baltobacteraceae bacterium]|nr:YihY/virulence factor BrkB family protein [Candidatus Baltobacteraceae bacterium]
MKIAWQVLRDAYSGWQCHQDGRLAAALAYYAVFSLAPLLLIVIALLGLFLGPHNAQTQVQGQLHQVVGPNGTQMIGALIAGANHRASGTIALIVGGTLMLFSAIGMFLALQNALDEVFEVRQDSKGGFMQLVVLRLHALLVIAALAVIAIVALALVNVIGGVMQTALGANFSGPLLIVGTGIINVVAMTVFLAVVYRVLPQRSIEWRSAFTGALVTAVILIAGEAALSMYFTRFHPATPYGAAGGIIILLLWVYYSAQLMLFGAEITRANEERLRPPQAAVGSRRGEVSEDLQRTFPASR